MKRLGLLLLLTTFALTFAQWNGSGVWGDVGGTAGLDTLTGDARYLGIDSTAVAADSAAVSAYTDSARVAVTSYGAAGTDFAGDTATFDVFQVTGGYSLPYEPYRTAVMSNNSASLTPDIDTYKQIGDSAIAADVTINAPTGTPVYGQTLLFHLVAAGADKNLTWNAVFVTGAYAVPDSIHASKKLYVGFSYNGAAWDCIASKEAD
jgi:hypothetical protein